MSDVDIGLVLRDPLHASDARAIAVVADALRLAGPLHERLSVFWGTPSSLRGETPGGRFPPLDRLDLIEHGRLLCGSDVRAELPRPDPADVLMAGAEFALRQLGSDATVERIRTPELLLRDGVVPTTKVVLFPVRFLFTAATGQVGANDAAVAHHLAGEHPVSAELVAAAFAWRTNAPGPQALALLEAELAPLYLHYLDDHAERLAAIGRGDLADAFRGWRRRLGAS